MLSEEDELENSQISIINLSNNIVKCNNWSLSLASSNSLKSINYHMKVKSIDDMSCNVNCAAVTKLNDIIKEVLKEDWSKLRVTNRKASEITLKLVFYY